MHSSAILHQVQQLCSISNHLDSLPEQHPLVSEILIGISGAFVTRPLCLEVLIATKITPRFGLGPARA
jgi:hypothetical protein